MIHFKQRELSTLNSSRNPFEQYETQLWRMELYDHLYRLHCALYSFTFPTDRAEELVLPLFFELKGEHSAYNDFCEEKPNWIAINQCLCKVVCLGRHFSKYSSFDDFWIPHPSCEYIIDVFDKLYVKIFNSSVIRRWTVDAPLSGLTKDETLFSIVEMVGEMVELLSWKEFDIDLDFNYLTTEEYNQYSFRNVCRWLPSLTVINIAV
eukprot:TRINITY_DN5894_c0_g1_i3.p1 TRINITY_DN5894_c0_g1~~TRINITY_DN5894_c0_g1_i3.p1  ORF type:complete len:207 (+),score=21.81 TRINITY_DN5894_c0_g1_i3:329-949(+)